MVLSSNLTNFSTCFWISVYIHVKDGLLTGENRNAFSVNLFVLKQLLFYFIEESAGYSYPIAI